MWTLDQVVERVGTNAETVSKAIAYWTANGIIAPTKLAGSTAYQLQEYPNEPGHVTGI